MLKDIISKLRKYEILIRKAVNTSMQGESHSVFKGSGLEFDDVRQYNYGDDIRTINWNISAKGNGTYINTYKEEKEQNVFFVLDVSASQRVGAQGLQKLDIGKEICGVLTISALREQSSVGLLCFSDKRERYVRPDKGNRQAAQILKVIFDLEPSSDQTNLTKAITMAMNIIKRKSVMILVSDFIDEDYEAALKGVAKQHDLICIHLGDPREQDLPQLGIVQIYDKESGKSVWVNTSSKEYCQHFEKQFVEKRRELENLCKRYGADYLYLSTHDDYVPKLIKLFKLRKTRRK